MKRLVKRVSIGGLIVAVISLAVFFNTDEEHFLGGGLALLARSFRPPLRFGRGFAAWLGGAFLCAGAVGAIAMARISQQGPLAGHLGIQEAIITMVVGAVLGLPLLWYGFKRDSLSAVETAEDAFSRAVKLEARGKLDEAAAAYRDIVRDFRDSDLAKDAEVSLAALEKKGAERGPEAD